MNIREAKQITRHQLSPLPTTHEEAIDEEYLDSNGHMNVAWYLHLFNRATGGMYKWLQCEWKQMRESGFSSFALEDHTRYFAEAMVGEHISIHTRLIARSDKRLQFLHFMFNDDTERVAATHEEILAFMDMNARQMTPYPEAFARQLDDALADHSSLDWSPPVCGVMKP